MPKKYIFAIFVKKYEFTALISKFKPNPKILKDPNWLAKVQKGPQRS